MNIDFHTHTKHSYDCLSSISRFYSKCKKVGLNAVAVTDHDEIVGAIELYKRFNSDSFKVIIGSEIKTDRGDIIGLFLKKRIKSRKWMDVIKEIRDVGGLSILPHPFSKNSSKTFEIAENVDLIEAFNSRRSLQENEASLNLAEKLEKQIVAGSDAHFISEIGKSFIRFDTDTENVAIKDIILKCKREIIGEVSPYYNHYLSALLGNYNKKTILRTIIKKLKS